MGERASDGAKHAASDEHKTFDWHKIWKSVEDAGTQAGHAIKEQVDKIDTKELGDKAKHAAGEGLKVVRGKSDNKQANEVSDTAAKYLPGAGLLRQGAELAHETGVDGKVLEGKKGPLRAPSKSSMKEVGKEAIGTAIPVPGGFLANEVLNKSGAKDKLIDGAVDSAKNFKLPDLAIEDKSQKDGGIIDGAKDKVGKFFGLFQKDEAKENKKK